jgi:hypothetical protein
VLCPEEEHMLPEYLLVEEQQLPLVLSSNFVLGQA